MTDDTVMTITERAYTSPIDGRSVGALRDGHDRVGPNVFRHSQSSATWELDQPAVIRGGFGSAMPRSVTADIQTSRDAG